MTTSIGDVRIQHTGNMANLGWNKNLCFQARDALYECVDAQENGNKFRCPDQLYAYDMWCPAEFRRLHTAKRQKDKLDELVYDKEWLERNNYAKQTLFHGVPH